MKKDVRFPCESRDSLSKQTVEFETTRTFIAVNDDYDN